MKILFLTEDYPSESSPYAMSYVHSRATSYRASGLDVIVGSFSAREEYLHHGIHVMPASSVPYSDFDIVFSHAPNIRNHVRSLVNVKGKRIVFTIHGHEVLRQFSDYPAPYPWNEPTTINRTTVAAYDELKISLLRSFFNYLGSRNRIGFIFVSEWMRSQFERNIGSTILKRHPFEIIPNPINDAFSSQKYTPNANFMADFITIRPFDLSKYAIDLVVNSAKANPDLKYHLYGKGRYFLNQEKPDNICVISDYIEQSKIPELLNNYKCAIMPTRYDSQGVMNCEMASYGIPLITTDISICNEMLSQFKNVAFYHEHQFSRRIRFPHPSIDTVSAPSLRFRASLTSKREIEFANGI